MELSRHFHLGLQATRLQTMIQTTLSVFQASTLEGLLAGSQLAQFGFL
jgi:hypothetical protein